MQDTLSPSQSRSPKEASRTRIAITGYAAIASKERIAPSRTTQVRRVRTLKRAKEVLPLRQRPMPLQPNGADKWNEATEEATAARRVRIYQRAPTGLSLQAGDRCGVGARADPPKRQREARIRNADTQRTVETLVGRARVGTSCAACKKKHPGVFRTPMQTSSCKHGGNCNRTHVQPCNNPRRPSAQRGKSPHTPRRHNGQPGGKPTPTPGRRRRGKKGTAQVAMVMRTDSLLCTPCGGQPFKQDSDQASTSVGQSEESVSQEGSSSCYPFCTSSVGAASDPRIQYDDGSLAFVDVTSALTRLLSQAV